MNQNGGIHKGGFAVLCHRNGGSESPGILNDQVIYEFPYYYENNTSNYLFSDVEAVAFRDVNGDEKEDVILIINYIFGAGPQGMIPRPEVRIYLASEKCFYLSEEINNTIQNTLADLGEEVTIDKVYEFIAGVFGSSKAD